jgi:hypothetical protein
MPDLAAVKQSICRRWSRITRSQQLHEIALRLVTTHQITEIGGVLLGLAETLPKHPHASDNAARVFIVALAAMIGHD